MRTMKKLYAGLHFGSNIVSRILTALLVLLVLACASTVFLQVINRYIIVKISDISFSFTDELSRWLMIIITYLAVGVCLREGSMAQVDLVYSRFGRRGRFLLYLATRILMAVVLYIGIRYGLRVMRLKAFMSSSMLEIPGWILYSPPFVGSVLMSYEWLTEIVGVLSGELEPFAAGSRRGFPSHEEPPEQIEA